MIEESRRLRDSSDVIPMFPHARVVGVQCVCLSIGSVD
jgi:hypothetical protein